MCRSQWPRGLRRRSSAARLLRFWVRIPPGAWMFVCCECCVLPGRGLCDRLITRPEESYRLWRVVVCDQETSKTRRLKPATGLWKYCMDCNARKTNKITYINRISRRNFQLIFVSLEAQFAVWSTDPGRTLCSTYTILRKKWLVSSLFVKQSMPCPIYHTIHTKAA